MALQVLLRDSHQGSLVAGLPAILRGASAAARLPEARIVFCGSDAAFKRRWFRQLANLGDVRLLSNGQPPAASDLNPDSPLLVLAGDGFPDETWLREIVGAASLKTTPSRWALEMRTVAAYFPKAAMAINGAAAAEDAARSALDSAANAVKVDANQWRDATNPSRVSLAEQALYAGLIKDTDGYFARLDRRLSIALSRLFIRTPLTPNHITTISLILGLYGAWALSTGRYSLQLGGALLLWFCCLLDGCDGEVARLKLLSSPWGASYDMISDHFVHFATFIAIPLGVRHSDPAIQFWTPAAILVSGFLACMFSVWYLVLRLPESKRGPLALIVERVASRDYVYLIVGCVALGHLEWFLWAAGIGSHLFNLGLWWAYSFNVKAPETIPSA